MKQQKWDEIIVALFILIIFSLLCLYVLMEGGL